MILLHEKACTYSPNNFQGVYYFAVPNTYNSDLCSPKISDINDYFLCSADLVCRFDAGNTAFDQNNKPKKRLLIVTLDERTSVKNNWLWYCRKYRF